MVCSSDLDLVRFLKGEHDVSFPTFPSFTPFVDPKDVEFSFGDDDDDEATASD